MTDKQFERLINAFQRIGGNLGWIAVTLFCLALGYCTHTGFFQ